MKKFSVFHWLAVVAVVAALPVAARAAPSDVMGDDSGTEPHFSSEPGFGHPFDPWGRDHDFAFRHDDGGRFRGRGFDRNGPFLPPPPFLHRFQILLLRTSLQLCLL